MSRRPNNGGPSLPALRSSDGSSEVPYGGFAGTRGEEKHVLDYLRVLFKRRWTALASFALVICGTAVYTLRATPIYEASVQLLVERENQNVFTLKDGGITNDSASQVYYETQYKILQSRSLAKKTLERLKLWHHPHFGQAASAPPQESSGLLGWISRARSWAVQSLKPAAPAAAEAPGAEETLGQSRAIDTLLGGLAVAPVKESQLVDVTFRSSDPSLAASVANALANAYIEQNLDFKFMASKDTSDWLAGQLAEQRKQVEASELALQQYRERSDSVSLEDRQNIVVQKLADLNAVVTRGKTQRIEKEALYIQLRSMQGDPDALGTYPAIATNPVIQRLKSELAELQRQETALADQLGDLHPEMVKTRSAITSTEQKLHAELGRVVESVRNEFVAAQGLEQQLANALESQKREALALNRKEIEYGVLEREVTSRREIFQSLLERARETGITGESKTSNIRIVDPAEVPRTPVWPKKKRNLLFAIFAGGLLAFGLTFLLDYMDTRIKTPDEIKAHLGLPYLGLVPLVRGNFTAGGAPLINNGIPPSFGEAFRAVRTNVIFSVQGDEQCLLVTSTGPGEGKTIVASNLAVGLALTGQRVLLMDADMRRPRVHDVFGLPMESGLSTLLTGQQKASEVIRSSQIPGLWILPSGSIPPNPAELLSSLRCKEVLGMVTKHFDWVIVDSPPVMAVTDASILAHVASGVLFVVGAGLTTRSTAMTAVEQLEGAGAKFLGAVLNRVDLQRNAFFYSQYYRREYGEYYKQSPLS